jgi:hypothetical protein
VHASDPWNDETFLFTYGTYYSMLVWYASYLSTQPYAPPNMKIGMDNEKPSSRQFPSHKHSRVFFGWVLWMAIATYGTFVRMNHCKSQSLFSTSVWKKKKNAIERTVNILSLSSLLLRFQKIYIFILFVGWIHELQQFLSSLFLCQIFFGFVNF